MPAKATFSTYCDGTWGILVFDQLFSQLKNSLPRIYFLFYSTSTQEFHVHAGEDLFLAKSIFHWRNENGALGIPYLTLASC